MNSKLRISILLILFAAEIAILYLLWTVGWESSVKTFSWIGSFTLASLPLFAIFLIIRSGQRRISLASLMLIIALIAFFLAAVILPIQNAKNLRRGTLALTSTGVGVVTNSSYPNLATHGSSPLPKWLRPLGNDALGCPCDTEVRGVMLVSDLDVSHYCENAQRFPNLREIQLCGPNISSDGLKRLQEVTQHSDKLDSLIVGDCQFNETILERMPSLTQLWIYEQGFGTTQYPKLSAGQLNAIAKLKALKTFTLQGYDVVDQDIGLLGQTTSLTQINFVSTKISKDRVDALDSALPKCFVTSTPPQ